MSRSQTQTPRIQTWTRFLALFIAPLLMAPLSAQVDVERIVKQVDDLYRADSSRSRLQMDIVTANWERTLVMEVWTQGLEKTFIRILEPPKERGVGTLRIGNEMWNYLPKTNKVIKIPPSMMMSSWMGSDFTNDDLVKEFTFVDDYTFQQIQFPESDDSRIFIECIPREDLPVVWGRVVLAVDRNTRLPIWLKYYDEQEELIRTLKYSDRQEFDGRTLPARMEMIPADEESRTVVRYHGIQFNVEIDEGVFSLRNLRSFRP